ncbi:hypothetical protein Godav_003424, partial [Gossypium davidsonii]|nr:hypothetical protein [Gossypium davidsonii]
DHNRSGCSEELLTGSSQEPYNGKLERAKNRTLFRAMMCPQHMQDHNQFGNPLADAIRVSRGGWFTGRKSKRIIGSVDADRNGFIDDNEIKNLAEFAEKYLNIKILYL